MQIQDLMRKRDLISCSSVCERTPIHECGPLRFHLPLGIQQRNKTKKTCSFQSPMGPFLPASCSSVNHTNEKKNPIAKSTISAYFRSLARIRFYPFLPLMCYRAEQPGYRSIFFIQYKISY